MKCPVCEKGNLERKRIKERMYGFDLGTYNAKVCDKCGESFIGSKGVRKIEKKAKELGIWGLKKEARAHKVGGSVSVIISKRLADLVGIRANERIEMYPNGKKELIIKAL